MGKKTLSKLLILILISCLIIAGYFINSITIKHDDHIINLTENSQIGKTVIRSKLRTPFKLVATLKGTINDTIIFDSKKIPPNFVDIKIYEHDWYADSAWFHFDPYKASKVKLKVTYRFYE